MNILYVLNSGRVGGMERHVLDLVTGMSKEGHKVYVWAPAGTEPKLYAENGAEVYEKYIRHEIDFKYIYDLTKFLKEKKIDILHAHELKAVSHSLIAGTLAGVKAKVTHSHTPISTWKINKIKKFIDSKIYTLMVNLLSDKEIALTPSVSKIKHLEGIKKEKHAVIPNAVSSHFIAVAEEEKPLHAEEIRTRYGLLANDFVFGILGRMSEEKGHDLLLDAFKLFLEIDRSKNSGQSFKLLMAGGGVCENLLKQKTNELGIEEHVVFTGVFKDEDKPKFFSAMHAFINPSYTEGFGITPIEAILSEIPVICSDIEVLREVVGDNVKYFKSGSAEHLAEAMYYLYENTRSGNYSINLKKAKSHVLSKYSMTTFISNYLELYKSLL